MVAHDARDRHTHALVADAEIAPMKRSVGAAARVPVGVGISPQHVVDAAYAALPADCRITLDAGAFMLPVLHLWRSAEPNQSLISRGLSTMGFALPAAIASCLADPKRRTIAFTGDGGLMMCLGELGTAVQEQCAPIVVVFNDSALTLIGLRNTTRRSWRCAASDYFPRPQSYPIRSGIVHVLDRAVRRSSAARSTL